MFFIFPEITLENTNFLLLFINDTNFYYSWLSSWKKLWSSIQPWVKTHGGKLGDTGYYCDVVQELLMQSDGII